MEINRFEDVLGVVTQAAVVEGKFVLLTANNVAAADFGSNTDLPGVKVPSSAEEAKKARYVVTFAQDNRPTPIFDPMPSFAFALRGGWDQADNVPFAATVYLTHPGNQEGLTVASGVPALAFTEGSFTLPSGAYVESAEIKVVGADIIVEYSGADAGKPKYSATYVAGVIGQTEKFDATTGRLTIKVE